MKKTININDNLNERVENYIKKYGMTYTTFLTLASEKYLDSLDKAKDIEKVFLEMMSNVKITNGKN